jgi:hypothetical protein
MMKTLLGILYLASFCVLAMAQDPMTANLALQQYLKASVV